MDWCLFELVIDFPVNASCAATPIEQHNLLILCLIGPASKNEHRGCTNWNLHGSKNNNKKIKLSLRRRESDALGDSDN